MGAKNMVIAGDYMGKPITGIGGVVQIYVDRKNYILLDKFGVDSYDGMEKACRRKGKRTTVYYCHPHAPHERGSNENMNRIIRRFFPKGTNFDEVPISEIRRAEEWMNNYPREVLGWQTAATLLRSYMSAC